jgi:uncharacterized repeat protein (TIGR01451 family)
MSVNYAHDWVEGGYTVGHTIWITSTEPVTTNVKAVAEMETQEIPWWGGGTGFSTNLDDPWVPERPDMEPHDWVFGALDNGETGSVRIGEIHGQIDLDADTITGTIHANWFTESLNGNCGVWEEGGPGADFTVDPDGGSYTCTFSTMGWDLLPGHDVGVGYQEPDGDWVYNVFREPTPDVGVDKWAEGSGQCAAGGFCVFTIRCRNDGDAVAETIWLTDTLPSDLTYWSDSSPVPTHVFPDWVFWELGPLAPGEEMRFQLVLQNSAAAGTWLTNQVDVFTQFDENPDNDHAEATVEVIEGQPDVYVDKDADPGDPAAGETYLYHINYSNNEPVASGYVLLTDTLPLSTTLESWSSWNEYGLWNEVSYSGNQLVLEVPSIPGHWGDTILLRLRVDGDAPEGTQLHNEVEIATAGDTNPDNNWQEHDTWVSASRWDAAVEKWFNWGELVPGGQVHYEMRLGNNGNMRIEHLWLTDTLPVGTIFEGAWVQVSGPQWEEVPPHYTDNGTVAWDTGSKEPGEQYHVQLSVTISDSVAAGTVFTNCVEVGTDGPDENPDNDSECVENVVSEPGPNLRLRKRVWWEGDGQLRYSIDLWNVGTEDLLGVWVTDTYPISTTWNGDWSWNRWSGYGIDVDHDEPNRRLVFTTERIEGNEQINIHFRVDLDGEIVGAPGLAFTNTVEAPYPGDVYPDDNYAEVVAYSREPAPDVYVQKWTEGSGQCAAGGLCVFSIRYGNEGEIPTGAIELTDDLPDDTTYVADSSGAVANVGVGWVSWELGPLDPGEERRFEIVVQNSAAPGEWLTNQVEVFTAGDSDPDDNHSEADVEVIEGQPDLNVNKDAEPGDPAAGQTYLYHIDYGNGQPAASGHVLLTETLPPSTTLESWWSWNGYGLWNEVSYIGNQLVLEAAAIPGHWGDTIMLRLRVDGDAPEGTQLHNEVEIATAGDTDPDNNWHEHDTWVSGPRWDGRVHKWMNWAELVPGGEVEYEMSFGNEGNMDVDHLWLTDTLPAGTVYQDSWLQESDGNWVQRPPDDVTNGTLAWDMGALEPAESHHLSLSLGIEEGVAEGTVLTNCVEVGIAGPDENPDNDTECVENRVSGPGPNLQLGKRVWWEGDGQLHYVIDLWNVGTEDLLDVWVTDTYPISTTWNGDWWWDRWSGYGIDIDHDEPNRRLIFTTERIERNEHLSIDFRVDLDGEIVGAPGLAFTNTVEAPYPGDVYEEDNYAEAVAYSREPAPDLWVEKWAEGSGQCAAGGPCVFNIRYGNEGDIAAAVIELTDTMPGGTTYVADSSGAVANVGAGWVSWELGPLDPGEERLFQFVLENTAGSGEWLTNQVEVFTAGESDLGDNHSEAEVEVIEGQPDLNVNKQAEPGDPAAGQTYLYHIDYGNGEPAASGHVLLTETLPPSTTLESWWSWNGYGLWSEVSYSGNQLVLEAAAIPGHWGDTIMLRLRVDGDAPEGTQLHNEVEIATAGDTDPGNNWQEHDTWVSGPRWDGRVHKWLNWAELVPGGEVEYEMSFGNEGNMHVDHLWLTDTLPAGTVYHDSWLQESDGNWVWRPPDDVFNGTLAWEMGPLEPAESHYLSLRLGIEEGVELGTVLTNCVEVGIAGPDENPDNDSECVESRVSEPGPNLQLGKRVWWEGDGQLRYSIDLWNVGTEDLLDVWVTDTYPISTTWNGDWWWDRWSGYGIDVDHDEPNRRLVFTTERIERNEQIKIHFRVDLDGEIVGAPSLAFTNTVESPYPGDVYPEDNYAEVVAYSREPAPDLWVEKWAEGSGQTAPGMPIVFTIRYRNDGEVATGPIEMIDTLPDDTTYVMDSSGAVANMGSGWVSWELDPLDPGDERHFEIVLQNAAPAGEWLRNQVDVFTPDDWNPDNNHVETEVEVIEGQPDVYVTKSAEPGDPAAGQTYVYHIDYGNNEPVTSGPVLVTETLPMSTTLEWWHSEGGYGFWNQVSYSGNQLVLEAAAIPGHWDDTIMLRLLVDGDAPEGTQLHNEVEVATAGDTNPDNNWMDHDAWVGAPRWQGRAWKALAAGQLVPEGNVEYFVWAGNNGNMATHAWLTDTLPSGSSFDQAWLWGPWGGPFPPDYVDDEIAAWDLGVLEPGEGYGMNLLLDIGDSVIPGTMITNCVETTIYGEDGNPDLNRTCVSNVVSEPGPNLRVEKRYWWEHDGQLRYQLDLWNLGSEDLDNVEIIDTYPLATAWNGDWWWDRWSDYDIQVHHQEPERQLIFSTERIEVGEHVWIHFRVDLDSEIVGVPGLAFGNVVEAPYPEDRYPDDNYDEVWAYSGPECPEPSAPGRPSPEDGAPDVGLHADLDWSDFDGRWWWENEDPWGWSLSDNPGYLRILTHPDWSAAENVLVQNAPLGSFTITTRVVFEPTSNFQAAGLVMYQDAGNYMMLERAYCDEAPPTCVGNGIYFDRVEGGALVDSNYAMETTLQGEAYLRVVHDGGTYTGYYSENGIGWTLVGSHTPTDTVHLSAVGVTAGADVADLRIPADFDYFSLQDEFDSYFDHFNGATSYDVHFGTTSAAPYVGSTTSSDYTLPRLDEWTQYYWEVVAVNDCGQASEGEWSFATGANHRPALGTVDPSSGSGPTGATTYFTTTWMDADGWEDLKQCYFHIGDGPSIVGNVTLLYNAVKNKLWIRSDDGTMWLGGYAPGSANTMGNSQAIVHCSLTTAEGAGDTLAVKWAIEFKVGYEGGKKTGLKCKDRDKARAKGKWKGTWIIY